MGLLPERPSRPSVDRLLCIAAAAGAEAAVRLHIARGDDLECRDKHGLTPLMIAASRNRGGVCRLLLQAGANINSRDPGGRDALSIARETASTEATEAILESTGVSPSTEDHSHDHDRNLKPQSLLPKAMPGQSEDASCPNELPATSSSLQDLRGDDPSSSEECPNTDSASHPVSATGSLPEENAAVSPAPAQALPAVVNDTDLDIPDDPIESIFGEWEPAIAPEAPPEDPMFAAAEIQRQIRINEHEPIDTSADWSNFEAELPEFAKPIPRADDADYLAALRRLLLLAAREGSVPSVAVEDLLSERGDALMRDQIAEAQLQVVLGDLGAGLDERLEMTVGNESFEIFVDPKESADEDRAVDEAIAFFEDLRSGRNDPVRIYLRSVGNKALLKKDRETAIAQAMESAVDRALDALARWPAGLKKLLESVASAESSPALLLPIVTIAREGSETDEESGDSSESDAPPELQQVEDASDTEADISGMSPPMGSTTSVADALLAFDRISELVNMPPPMQETHIREQLRALSFRRTFLANLGDRVSADHSTAAGEYHDAVATLLSSRNEMVQANLRLVYATAKQYLYSGLPLDDLMQEGNIGLIKAVDRFEWRRGYKFSTMAVWWIKQQIGRSIPDTAYSIRLPVHVFEKVSKHRLAAEAFERTNRREPRPDERAAMLGVSIQKMEAFLRPISDPAPIDEVALTSSLTLDEIADPMDIVAESEVARLLGNRIAELGRKTEQILRMRFGIGVDVELTLEQIGNVLAVTRERVRQVEAKGLRRLSTFGSREQLAIALGRPLPQRPTPTSETNPAKDEAAPVEIGEQPASIPDLEELPPPVRRIIDFARLLGVKVTAGCTDCQLGILIDDVHPVDQDSRRLVADMLQTGFIHEPGTGYRI